MVTSTRDGTRVKWRTLIGFVGMEANLFALPVKKNFQKSHMQNHIQARHPGYRFRCPDCDKKYTTYDKLKVHYSTIHEGNKHACEFCDYVSNFKKHLIEHVKVKHEGVKYRCTECLIEFKRRRNLITHIKFKHHNIGGFTCPQCEYRTLDKSRFSSHIQSHLNKTKESIKCQKCNKICPSKEYYNCHTFFGCSYDPSTRIKRSLQVT